MSARHVSIAVIGCLLAAAVCRGGEEEDPKKKAERVTSYVLLAETITRVGMEVGGMLDKHPYERPLCQYAKELGALHAKAILKHTPPKGAAGIHACFKEAVTSFALAADAQSDGDYPAARRHRERCVKQFAKTLLEVIKLRKEGVIP